MPDVWQFVFNQLMKDIWISIPGIIETYNSSTKRCTVKPALNIRLTDGITAQQTSIVNVPVVWPSGGGFTLLSPLPAGTPVEIKFSQRGITKFKETFSTEDPGSGIFNKDDAVVIPSYGGLSVTPATENGISIQSEDGTNYIFVESGNIESESTVKIKETSPIIEEIASTSKTTISPIIQKNAATSYTVVSPLISLGTGSLLALLNSTAATLYNSHTHTESGAGTTGTPNQQMVPSNQTTETKAS